MRVVLGSINRFIHTKETVIVPAKKIIVHPDYRRGESFANDIGLIIVSRILFLLILNQLSMSYISLDHQLSSQRLLTPFLSLTNLLLLSPIAKSPAGVRLTGKGRCLQS